MVAYITVGAKTTHGGTVITGSPQTTHYGIPIARKGDKVVCKKCKKVVTIITGDPSYIVDGAPIARAGDMTSCGSKLIANQQAFSESGFDVGSIAQAEPLQFAKSDMSNSPDEQFDEQFEVLDENNKPIPNIAYRILDTDTQEILTTGVTDSEGLTTRVSTDTEKNIEIIFV